MKRKIIEMICIGIIIICVIYVCIVGKDKRKIDKTKEFNSNSVEKYVEEYMEEIVADEWDNELIKTMAVIIRTGWIYDNVVKKGDTIDGIKNQTEKNKMGNKELNNRVKAIIVKCIEETCDEIITYHGNVIYPFYHEVSSGITKSEDKLSGVKFGYLKEKKCNKDITSKEFFQIKYFNKKDVVDRANKELKFNSYEVMNALGLNSVEYSITTYTENEDILRVVCRGKGHGLGLSIYDANNLAKEGLSYKDIINSYYKDIVIKKCIYE